MDETPQTANVFPYGIQVDPAAWVQQWREQEAARFKEEFLWMLRSLSVGQRIRYLRECFAWTQEMAALQLGVSRRTIIRHEQAQHRRPWLQLEFLFRLRKLELDHADEVIAYISRAGREHA